MNDRPNNKGFPNMRLAAALDCLTQAQRIAYLLGATDGLSLEAIAFRVGATADEVQRYLAEALYNLTSLMDDP